MKHNKINHHHYYCYDNSKKIWRFVLCACHGIWQCASPKIVGDTLPAMKATLNRKISKKKAIELFGQEAEATLKILGMGE